MIRDDAALAAALPAFAAARRVALDTEFHTERHYHPRLMLLQVRADEQAPVLIDPLAGLDLAPLASVLEAVPLVVHGGVADVEILHRLTGFVPREVHDTQLLAGCAGDGFPIRLQDLVRRHLSRRMDKAETLSDWSRRPLTPGQLRYAEDDVLVLAPLADALAARVEALGNAEIARACTAEVYARALAPPDDATAWRSLQGSAQLDDAERGVARALAEWRERTARGLDVPRHQVLSDALLVDLARRQPRTIEAMRANRRMPSQVWKRDGDVILGCIRDGLAAPPPPSAPSRGKAWRDTLQAAARIAESSRGVAVELVLDEAALRELSADVLPGGWRRHALGPDFAAFILGRALIRSPGVYESRDNS